MKVCIYLRKSRADSEAEARGEGETLARHEKILLEVAKKHKLPIEKIYREIVSGETIASRPVMQQLLSEVEQGIWTDVLVMEVERLARGDTIDQGIMSQAFKYSNTKIITPNKIYDPQNEFDEEYFEFGLFMSRREYKTINRRLQQGRTASVKEGKYVGNKPPYGYIRVPLEKEKGFTLALHPEQAPIVKMIFDLYVNGENGNRLGVSLIVRRLNKLKIPSATGDVWAPSSIQTIIRNPVYIGKIRWNSRKSIKKVEEGIIKIERPRAKKENWLLSDGLHSPIIDVETFELANIYIDTNRPNPNPSQCTTKNPLSGLIECALCGRKMIRRPYYNRNQSDTLMCPSTHCANISSSLNLVENTVIEMLKNWLNEYKITTGKTIKTPINTEILVKSIERIEKEIDTLNKQLNKTYDLLEQGIYDTDTFLDRTKSISEKITIQKSEKETIEKEIETIKIQQEAKEKIIPKIDNIINTYELLTDPGEKNNLLKQVLEKATYLKTSKNTKRQELKDVTITLYPRTY